METEVRPAWRRRLREALRPEEGRVRLSRRAVGGDAALAVLLTVAALLVATRYPGTGPVRLGPATGTVVPVLPQPPALGPVPGPVPTQPWALVVLSTLPLAARRRYPLTTFAVVLGAALAIGGGVSWITVLACVAGAYSAVMYSRYRLGAMAALAVAAVLAGFAFRDADPVFPGWSSPAVVLLIAGVLAGVVRYGQRRLAASRERLAALRRAHEEATRRAVAEERARIAAELHDVVTHNVSVMVIQAGAARKVMDTAPEQSKQALLAVEAGGRAALAELRHVMGLLAGPGTAHSSDGLEPQPGLGQLAELVERVRAAGTPVDVTLSLPPRPLPPGVELTAYRVVQEALTNTLRHAPGAAASVTVGHTGGRLVIEVTDSGPEGAVPDGGGTGRGLIGLRERLAVYGGELTAGPAPARGYRVRAELPWGTP